MCSYYSQFLNVITGMRFLGHPLYFEFTHCSMSSSNIWDLIDLTRTNERKRFGSKRVKPRFEYKRNILLARNTYNQLIHIHFLSYEKHPGKKVLAWIFVRAVTIQFNLGLLLWGHYFVQLVFYFWWMLDFERLLRVLLASGQGFLFKMDIHFDSEATMQLHLSIQNMLDA